MNKFLPALLFLLCISTVSLAQVSLTGSTYNQTFDDVDGEGLASSGMSTMVPAGWSYVQTNPIYNEYFAGTGGSTLPATMSFGEGGSIERAFGMLRGHNLTTFSSIIGASFTNNTGGTIEGLQISYTGEQWRLGDDDLNDRLLFYYSTDATGIGDESATWIAVTDLHFDAPITEGDDGALNGNLAANSTELSTLITDLSIPEGETFFIRWIDEDQTTTNYFTEHGLGVDDFSLIPFGGQTRVYLDPDSQTLAESDGATLLIVAVENPSLTQATSVDLDIVGGTGDASDIGGFTSQTVIIPAGETIMPVFILITDDSDVEGDENIIFGLSNPSGGNSAVLGTPSESELIIQDNDIAAAYYRTLQSGAWTDASTWEFSTDGFLWDPSVDTPDNSAGPVVIQSGHTVTLSSTLSIDELTISGTLNRAGGDFTLTNGAGVDMQINNGGRFIHSGSTSQPVFTGTVNVAGGGIIEVRNNTNNQSVYGTSTRVTWQTSSIFLWNVNSAFASGTYFPNTAATTVPVFRVQAVGSPVGDATDLLINGRFDVQPGVTIEFGGAGLKTFRNALVNNGEIVQNGTSGALRITGSNAFIGGNSAITLSTGGFRINQFSTCFLTVSKTFNGGTLTVNGSLTFSSGAAKTLTLTHSGAGSIGLDGTGTLNMSATAGNTILIAAEAPVFPTTFTVGTGSIVNFNSADAQTIPARNFANLVSSSTGARTLASTGTIGVAAAFTPGTNVYTTDGSTISYNGAAQNVAGFGYENLTIAGSGNKTLAGAASLTGTLNINASRSFDTNGNEFVLVSSATETASIGVLPASASIIGDVTTQRYMPAEGRIYRYISSPVDQPAVSQLQDDFAITGTFTGADVIPGVISSPSFYYYDETQPGTIDDGYVDYPSASNAETLVNGLGYAAFIRNESTPTVIDLVGSPNTHNMTLPVTYTDNGTPADDGWNLVGNPYPAAIDWSSGGWTKTNLDDAVYIRDNGAGGVYASFVNGVGANGGTGVIASGQAFWVKANAASPQLAVTENTKSADNSAEFFRSAPLNVMRIKMSQGAIADEIVVYFSDELSNDFVMSEDAYNLPNEVFDLASVTASGELLSINGLNNSFCQVNIPLHISKMNSGEYTMSLGGLETLMETMTVTLHDAFTGETAELSATGEYAFSVTTEEASAAPDRFTVSFDKGGSMPEITVNNGMLEVNHTTGIQWFFNGEPIEGETASIITPGESGEYSVEITNGTCIMAASVEYTITSAEEFDSRFRVYPNPTRDFLNFNITDQTVGNVSIELIDLRGARQMMVQEVIPGQTKQLNLSNLSSGIYILSVITGEKTYIHRIVKE